MCMLVCIVIVLIDKKIRLFNDMARIIFLRGFGEGLGQGRPR